MAEKLLLQYQESQGPTAIPTLRVIPPPNDGPASMEVAEVDDDSDQGSTLAVDDADLRDPATARQSIGGEELFLFSVFINYYSLLLNFFCFYHLL